MIGPRTRAVTDGFDWHEELPWVDRRIEGRIGEWKEGKASEEVVYVWYGVCVLPPYNIVLG